jgi:uncharacterized protein
MSRRKILSIAGLSGTAALVAAAGGATWYYADRLTEPPVDAPAGPPDVLDVAEVAEVAVDTIRLTGTGVARRGVWGLQTATGYAQVHEVVEAFDDNDVERRYVLLHGSIEPEQAAVFDAVAWPAVADVVLPDVVQVVYQTPLGPAPAWFRPGSSSTWLIAVHGRGAKRHEALRLAHVTAGMGIPLLAIAYRNDGEGPRSPDNRSHLGAQEWADVEAAIRHAIANGAKDVVLVGYSMGGACVTAAVRLSNLADHVRALILEAPVLDWGPVVQRAALARGLPKAVLPALLPATMALARLRVGIDWDQLRPDPAALELPVLLMHGTADEIVPIELSDAFADARPDIVTYRRFGDAGHVRCWNLDPDGYAEAIRDFLDRIGVLGP